MTRGELYRVRHLSSRDPKRARVFVVVSRQALMESRFSTVICAPVYSRYDGLATQVPIGHEEGLKHESSVHLLVPKLGLGTLSGSSSFPEPIPTLELGSQTGWTISTTTRSNGAMSTSQSIGGIPAPGT